MLLKLSCWVIFKYFGVAFHIKQAGTRGKISTHTKKLAQHRQQQHKIWRLHDTHTCTSLLQRANSAFYYAGCMVKKKNFLELQAPIICQCLLRTFSTFSGLGKTTLVGISRLITMQQACLMVQGHWRGLSVPFMQFCKFNFRPQCLDDVYL